MGSSLDNSIVFVWLTNSVLQLPCFGLYGIFKRHLPLFAIDAIVGKPKLGAFTELYDTLKSRRQSVNARY
jgi:hypothetical protein